MDIIRLNPECVSCIVKKQIERYPSDAKPEEKIEYMQRVLKTIADAPKTMSAPEIVDKIYSIQKQMFDMDKDYKDIKTYFNNLMLEVSQRLNPEIENSSEPLKLAIQYAMTGNYIDFATMESVSEDKLRELLSNAKNIKLNENEYISLKSDVVNADKLVYLTDNCGEIALDRLFIEVIKKLNPNLNITVIVRGMPVVNDATMEDAKQIGLTDIAEVIGNGSSVAGTCIDIISCKAREKINCADVIISKGQGNFETLQKCGLNIYYIFMCKCKMFVDRFNIPLYQGMLINDTRIQPHCTK